MSKAQELAAQLDKEQIDTVRRDVMNHEAAALLRTQDALLRRAAETLSQLSSVAIGTEHGREFKYQVEIAVEVYGAIKEHLK